MLLAYSEDEEANKTAQRPELHIVTRTNDAISSDALSLHGYEGHACNDYRVAHLPRWDGC